MRVSTNPYNKTTSSFQLTILCFLRLIFFQAMFYDNFNASQRICSKFFQLTFQKLLGLTLELGDIMTENKFSITKSLIKMEALANFEK